MFDNLDDFKKKALDNKANLKFKTITSVFLLVMVNKNSESLVLVKKLLKLKNMSNTKT